MRQFLEPLRYLDFTANASPKVVEDYRRKYESLDHILDATPLVKWWGRGLNRRIKE